MGENWPIFKTYITQFCPPLQGGGLGGWAHFDAHVPPHLPPYNFHFPTGSLLNFP